MAAFDFKEYLLDSVKSSEIPVTATSKIQYPTGFMYLDYGSGSYLTVCDDEEVPIYTYHNVGIGRGSVNVLISKSQGGKTTLAINMGSAIIEPYINRMLYERMMESEFEKKNKNITCDGMPFIQILDTEKTLPVDYVKRVSNYTNKLIKKHVTINPITTDKDLIRCLEQHVRYKVTHMKKIQMPMQDIFGNVIMEYPPTVMIIDSASQLLLEDCDDPSSTKKGKKSNSIEDIYESNTQNTAGARRAKVITALYSQLVNYADRYNIIIFSINHINKMLPMNGIPVKQYRGLRAGETIGGGERAIYLATSILRLDVIKNVSSVGTTSINLGDSVTGHIAAASWIKSKSNSKSNSCQLVYTNLCGYDTVLSNLWNAKDKGRLVEKGRFLYLPGSDEKFTMKSCRDVFAEHPEMFGDLYDFLREDCSELLDNPERAAKNEKKLLAELREDLDAEVAAGNYTKHDALELDDLLSGMVNE